MTEGPDDDGTGEDGAHEATADAGDRAAEDGTRDSNAVDEERQRTDDPQRGRTGDTDEHRTEDGETARTDDAERRGSENADRRSHDGESQAEGDARPETVAVDTAGQDTTDGGADVGADSAHGVDDEGDDSDEPSERAATDAAGDGSGAPADDGTAPATGPPQGSDVPPDVRKYDRFKKIDGGTYDRANEFLRDRTYITAREWAIARLCADFRTETGVEMTKIGENLPELVPFMTDTYTPQAVNQARASFEEKVRKSGATFLYGAMCDFFTAEELDDVMYEATEVAKFLLEVEGVELSVDEELEAEDRISEVMREVREHSAALRHDEMTCPECGHEMNVDE